MSKKEDSDLETENKRLKSENETLKHENAELKETVDKLKQSLVTHSLDEAVKASKPKPIPAPRGLRSRSTQASSETADSELRKLIKDLQDRLTIAEQVTAATQKRELEQEEDYEDYEDYENLPKESIYENLRFYPSQVYAAQEKTTHTGCITVFSSRHLKL